MPGGRRPREIQGFGVYLRCGSEVRELCKNKGQIFLPGDAVFLIDEYAIDCRGLDNDAARRGAARLGSGRDSRTAIGGMSLAAFVL